MSGSWFPGPGVGVDSGPRMGGATGGPEAGGPGPGPAREPVVHPRVWQRRVAVLRDQARRRLRWVVAGVGALVALCVALLALHTPLLALRHATVVGAQHTGADAVLQAAGLVDHPPLIDVDPKSAALRVERLPWVAHADVVRHWPDSVKIVVTERVPLGAVPRPGGGVALVDATGRVLAWQGSALGLILGAPVTPGLPGTVLALAARPALAVAAALPPPSWGASRRSPWTPGGTSRWASVHGSARCWDRPRTSRPSSSPWPVCWPGRGCRHRP